MTAVGICLFALGFALAAIQAVFNLKLAAAFRQPAPPLLTNDECPEVVVVLCLRGTDPFLPTMLRRLITQDYPRFRVRVVIDSATDPARAVVEEVIRQTGAQHVDVLVLEHRDRHCAARNSSLLKGTEDLPAACRFVVTVDGDVVLHRSCLREVMTGLVRADANVACGIRWFAPTNPTFGSIVRLQWSLACSGVMYGMRLPWGGCLAISRDVITDSEYRGRVARAFGDDMLLGSFLQQRGEKLVFVPQATIVNRESITLRGLFTFLTRHMLYVRWNHHRWGWILGSSTLLVLLMLVVCPLGVLHSTLRPWCIACLACQFVMLIVSMAVMGHAARKTVAARGEDLIRMTPAVVLTMLVAAPVTQLMTLLSNVAACLTRQTTWRGLTYRFGGNPAVTVVKEVPVAQLSQYAASAIEESA